MPATGFLEFQTTWESQCVPPVGRQPFTSLLLVNAVVPPDRRHERSPSSARSLLAVWQWRWPWRVWCLIAASVPVVYFLSAIPILTLSVELFNLTGRYEIVVWMESFYRPVFWLEKHSEFAGLVIAWEQHVMMSLFGRSA